MSHVRQLGECGPYPIYVTSSKGFFVLTQRFKARQGQGFINYFLIFTEILKIFVRNLSC